MFRKRNSGSHSRRSSWQRNNWLSFMRRPPVQISIVLFAFLVIVFLAFGGQKVTVSLDPTTFPPPTVMPEVTATEMPDVISVTAAYSLYTSNSAYILDVRERSEWDLIHIPSTTLLPLGQIESLVDKFPSDKPIIVISAADTRSQQASEFLKKSGYSNVTSMSGGIIYWKTQGYPVEP
ncbi:MAG: rhodanese-like domain-containing protein [Chloroflexi bacterium]|nr:rhodanese-like domain-containing protein [Chloroflexota bacterium]